VPRPARESDNGPTLGAARDAGDIASVLRVIWFQDDLDFPIDPCVLSQFAIVDWDRHAVGWLPQRRRRPPGLLDSRSITSPTIIDLLCTAAPGIPRQADFQLVLIVLPSAASSSCRRAPATPIVSGCAHFVSRSSTTVPPTGTSLSGAG